MKQREDAECPFFKQSILFQRGEEEHGGKVARAGSSIPLGWVRAAYPTHGYPRTGGRHHGCCCGSTGREQIK